MKRVYYNKEEEEYLIYHSQEQYYKECQLVESLPITDEILLRHMSEFMIFVENMVEDFYPKDAASSENGEKGDSFQMSSLERAVREIENGEESEEMTLDVDDHRHSMDVKVALGVAWNWHNEMSEMKRDLTGLYAKSFLLSWTGFCKLYHLSVTMAAAAASAKATEEKRAMNFPYFKEVQQEVNVMISSLPISQYKMTHVWNSMRHILPTLYIFSYSQNMRDYLDALFYRYCDLFCSVQPNLGAVLDNPLFMVKHLPQTQSKKHAWQEEEEEEEEDDDDNYNAYRNITIPLDENYSLKSEYFYEGEIVFSSQLRRMRLSRRLELQHETNPIILKNKPSNELMVKCNYAVLEMLKQVCVHQELKQFVIEDFKKHMMSLYIYHGERERYRRRWPEASSGDDVVLSVCRPADHLNANNMKKMKLSDIIDKSHEKEIVLITKCVTHRWLGYNGYGLVTGFIDKHNLHSFVIEQMVSLDYINELLTDNEEKEETMFPTFLTLVHTYYVLYKGGVFKSELFVEAFMLWMELLVEHKVVKRGLLHPIISEILDYFVPC